MINNKYFPALNNIIEAAPSWAKYIMFSKQANDFFYTDFDYAQNNSFITKEDNFKIKL